MEVAMLEKAIAIAVNAHRGQQDKAGKPYILHPLRVMNMGKTEEEMICGVLHDVIEDTDLTLENLRQEGYTEEIVNAVDAISRRDGECYDDFIERIATNHLATRVKLNDLIDNMDNNRIVCPQERDCIRKIKYEKAYDKLKKIMDSWE
jgi:(p)ppGpp synthase/HD superfamily hydrolase